jgi:aminoglycoside 3-N-acetyltransferase
VAIAETDHCCRRFELASDWLRAGGSQREGVAGHAAARLCEARDVVRLACEQLALDPLVFLCPAVEGCIECDAARSSVG